MPRYFFNCEGALTHLDQVGTELPDLSAARLQAIDMAGQLLKDHPHELEPNASWVLTVSEEEGSALFVVRLRTETRTAAR